MNPDNVGRSRYRSCHPASKCLVFVFELKRYDSSNYCYYCKEEHYSYHARSHHKLESSSWVMEADLFVVGQVALYHVAELNVGCSLRRNYWKLNALPVVPRLK